MTLPTTPSPYHATEVTLQYSQVMKFRPYRNVNFVETPNYCTVGLGFQLYKLPVKNVTFNTGFEKRKRDRCF